ncbi:MAG: hypothetical protein IS632_00455 [Thaumarchaeota archaeon]|nr:hypothetical protein [Nitrososphaerota archaeon]
MADEVFQKILAFHITDTSEGDAKNLPGMLDQTLNRLGIPLEYRSAEPAVSMEVDGTPTDENTVETVTEHVCDCSCCRRVAWSARVGNAG